MHIFQKTRHRTTFSSHSGILFDPMMTQNSFYNFFQNILLGSLRRMNNVHFVSSSHLKRKNLYARKIMISLLFLMHIHTVEMRYRTQLYSTLATSRSGTARNQFVMGWQWKVVDVCVFVSTTRLPRWRFIIWFLGNNPFRLNIVHWKRYFSIGWVCRETRKELTSAKVFGAHVKISFGENYTKTNHKLQYIRQICRHQLNSKLASWESWLSNGIGSVE